MSGFVKVDSGIVRSSLWIDRDGRSLFLTALFMAELWELHHAEPQLCVRSLEPTGWIVPPGWYGLVRTAGTALVRTDGMPDLESGLTILEKLGEPDDDSRSQEFEGRRLVRINGGYVVLNYLRYRERDYTAAERMRRFRQRKKVEAEEAVARDSDAVTRNVTQAESREQRADTTTTAKPRAKSWLAPYLEAWESVYSGTATAIAGRLAKSVKPLHDKHGAEKVVEQLRKYLAQTPADFANPTSFAQRFGAWTGKRSSDKGQSKQERGLDALKRGLEQRAEANGEPHRNQHVSRALARVVPDPRPE